MNLLALGKVLLDLGLPVLGTVLGVPELAPVAVDMVKDALGLPKTATNEQIAAAAKADPQVLIATEATAAEKWKALAAIAQANAQQATAINSTMQAEVNQPGGVSWYHWRHLIGYVTLMWLSVPLPFVVAGMWILVSTGKADVLTAIIGAMVALVTWVAICAGLNGFIAQDTSKRTTAAAAGEPVTGIIGGIVKAIGGKK